MGLIKDIKIWDWNFMISIPELIWIPQPILLLIPEQNAIPGYIPESIPELDSAPESELTSELKSIPVPESNPEYKSSLKFIPNTESEAGRSDSELSPLFLTSSSVKWKSRK